MTRAYVGNPDAGVWCEPTEEDSARRAWLDAECRKPCPTERRERMYARLRTETQIRRRAKDIQRALARHRAPGISPGPT